jgi:hypothetical protein
MEGTPERTPRPALPNRAARGSGILSGSGASYHFATSSPGTSAPSSVPGTPLKRSASTVYETPTSSRPPSRADDISLSSSLPFSPTISTRSESSQSTKSTLPTSGPVNQEATIFEQLFLRVPTHLPMWVYCAELQEITTLVVISKGLVRTKIENAVVTES